MVIGGVILVILIVTLVAAVCRIDSYSDHKDEELMKALMLTSKDIDQNE